VHSATFFHVTLCAVSLGFHIIHSIVNILLVYLVLLTTAGTGLSVILAFVVNMVCKSRFSADMKLRDVVT